MRGGSVPRYRSAFAIRFCINWSNCVSLYVMTGNASRMMTPLLSSISNSRFPQATSTIWSRFTSVIGAALASLRRERASRSRIRRCMRSTPSLMNAMNSSASNPFCSIFDQARGRPANQFRRGSGDHVMRQTRKFRASAFLRASSAALFLTRVACGPSRRHRGRETPTPDGLDKEHSRTTFPRVRKAVENSWGSVPALLVGVRRKTAYEQLQGNHPTRIFRASRLGRRLQWSSAALLFNVGVAPILVKAIEGVADPFEDAANLWNCGLCVFVLRSVMLRWWRCPASTRREHRANG